MESHGELGIHFKKPPSYFMRGPSPHGKMVKVQHPLQIPGMVESSPNRAVKQICFFGMF
jgi:hypothetical protein